MSSDPAVAPAPSPTTIWLGLDVHKETVTIVSTIAVLRGDAPTPDRVDRLPNDLAKLKRYLARLAGQGPLRAVYEASGAGYVLHRACTAWGVPCDVIAPSLIPTKPGVQRKHDTYDTYDAIRLARLHRAGELTVIRIPTEAEERVRDLVRCRETFQRELLKSRYYVLKFLARRGGVYLKKAWTPGHYAWLRQLPRAASPLVDEDRIVFGEYLALLEYKLVQAGSAGRPRSADRAAGVDARARPGARPGGRPAAMLPRDRRA